MTATHDDSSAIDQSSSEAADGAFDDLGRRAGAALRAPADPAALQRVVARGRRQQTTRRAAAVGATGALVVAVLVGTAMVRYAADGPTDEPATTLPNSTVPNSTVPVVAADEPWIAHVRDNGDGFRVHLVRPDGTGLHPLGGLPDAGTNHPEWSPDGARLLVTVDSTADIWMVDVDGSGARSVVGCVRPCVWVDEPSWSSDGDRIAFQRVVDTDDGIRSTIEVLDLATSTIDVVAAAPPNTVYVAPDWSPDGSALVVEVVDLPSATVEAEPTGSALGILDLDAGVVSPRMITAPDRFANNPDWSPTDDRIVFAERTGVSGDATDLFTIAPDGTGRTALTDHTDGGDGSANFPMFEPDGQRVVYSLVGPRSPEVLMSVSIDGSDRRSAAPGDSLGLQPAVRPT